MLQRSRVHAGLDKSCLGADANERAFTKLQRQLQRLVEHGDVLKLFQLQRQPGGLSVQDAIKLAPARSTHSNRKSIDRGVAQLDLAGGDVDVASGPAHARIHGN